MNTEQPGIPEDLQALYDDCTADDSRATCTTTSGFMCGLVERIARLTSDLAEAREDASQNTARYLACEKRFEEAIAQRDAANLRVEGLMQSLAEQEQKWTAFVEKKNAALVEIADANRIFVGKLVEEGQENAALTTRLEGLIRDNRASAAEVVELRQEVEQSESRFTAHLQHVSRFLTEMYQTMIDPLDEPEPSVKVAELCEMLLNQAREDREKLNRSPFNYPADWNKDSSLETWFPLTAEEMVKLKAENAVLKARVEQLSGPVSDEEWDRIRYWHSSNFPESETTRRPDVDALIRARSERSSHD